jgi:hypothetical protein
VSVAGRPVIAVMARVPQPGAVKTRLAAQVGPDLAVALYAAFLGDLDERLDKEGHPTVWFQWPAEPSLRRWVPRAPAISAQWGADLGERMAGAFADCFAMGHAPVVMLGADAPHFPAARVAEALGALASGREIVIGPAEDGGYYLIGLRRPMVEVFRDIPWGTHMVYETTLQRLATLGLTPEVLPSYFDIDDGADLDRLIVMLAAAGAPALPRTQAVLTTHGRFAAKI